MVSCDSGFTAALQSKVVARLSSSRPCDKGDVWAGEVRLAGPHFWFAVGGCSEKSELKEPKRSRLLAHRQHGSGSIRMFDRTLLEAIEEGIVPRPGLLTYLVDGFEIEYM